jgi:2-polyprenyl-3-methyl-5-hydroxy-6-metoxy-1,4-benzoquinol methylase
MSETQPNNIDGNFSALGMLSIPERQYLYEYGKLKYLGKGQIVDLGCWLGSSTIPLAMGLSENLNNRVQERQIHAYDLFIWEAWMNQFVVDTSLQGKYQPGDSFLLECQRQIETWSQYIKLCPGDLTQLAWQGDSIEFLFIDAMKSWALANSIFHNFIPYLIPEISLLVHQDFAHFGTHWIHPIMYRLRSYFKPIYDIPDSWSLVFQYQKPIPDRLLRESYSPSSFDLQEIDAAFEYSKEIVAPQKRAQISGAKAIALLERGEIERSRQEIERAISDGLSYADLKLPLGLGLSSLMLHYLRPQNTASPPVEMEVKNPDFMPEKSLNKPDLEYTGERHMADRLGLGLSLSHIDHMIRYALAAPFIKGRRVLDITCGSGYGSQFMAIEGAKEVIGVDIDPKAIAHARKFYHHPKVSYIESDAHAVSQLENASCEVIVSFETIEHLQHPHDFLLELRRILKPGGQLLLSCPNDYRVSPWISEYHIHKFRFSEFQDLVLNVFEDAAFLFQYNTATSCLIKPVPIPEKSSRFQNYRESLPQDFFGKQYLDGILTIDNTLGYLAVVGIESDRLTNYMSISQTAFQDVMSSLKFQTEEAKRQTQEVARQTQDIERQTEELKTLQQELDTSNANMQKVQLDLDQCRDTIAATEGGRWWHLQQAWLHLKQVVFSPKSRS